MNEFMELFYEKFCEVEFLCHQGEPNWLGWIAIGIGAWVGLLLLVTLFFSILALVFR